MVIVGYGWANINHEEQMKRGDIVKFKGFRKYPIVVKDPNRTYYGIVVRCTPFERVDVLWGNGIVGLALFTQTLEIVSECW